MGKPLFLFKEKIIALNARSNVPKAEHTLNQAIPYRKVFVVDENNEKVGVLERDEAIAMAKAKKMDLVLISVQPKPIAKILDYGKFKYDRKKKAKEAKEKQTNIQNRQVRLTPLIGQHDLETKARKAREFLLNGDRLKVSLKFRGRELTRQELGHETLNKFFALVEDIAEIAKEATLTQDRFLDLQIQPSKNKIAKFLKEQQKTEKDHAKNEDKELSQEEN
nr:translation initiation factor IF-3 [Mycoplasmopsis equigenitalium]